MCEGERVLNPSPQSNQQLRTAGDDAYRRGARLTLDGVLGGFVRGGSAARSSAASSIENTPALCNDAGKLGVHKPRGQGKIVMWRTRDRAETRPVMSRSRSAVQAASDTPTRRAADRISPSPDRS